MQLKWNIALIFRSGELRPRMKLWYTIFIEVRVEWETDDILILGKSKIKSFYSKVKEDSKKDEYFLAVNNY